MICPKCAAPLKVDHDSYKSAPDQIRRIRYCTNDDCQARFNTSERIHLQNPRCDPLGKNVRPWGWRVSAAEYDLLRRMVEETRLSLSAVLRIVMQRGMKALVEDADREASRHAAE